VSLTKRFYWERSVSSKNESWIIYDKLLNEEYCLMGSSDAIKFMVNRLAKSNLLLPHYDKIADRKSTRKLKRLRKKTNEELKKKYAVKVQKFFSQNKVAKV